MSTIGTTLFSKIEINGQEVDIATLDAADGIYALPAGQTTANVKFTMIDNTSIPRGVFEENSYITAMTLPDAMTYIASYSFHGVNNINISDKNAILAINPYAFDAEPTPPSPTTDPDIYFMSPTLTVDYNMEPNKLNGNEITQALSGNDASSAAWIVWSTDNSSIATVNHGGYVIANGNGTVNIIAEYTAHDNYNSKTVQYQLTITNYNTKQYPTANWEENGNVISNLILVEGGSSTHTLTFDATPSDSWNFMEPIMSGVSVDTTTGTVTITESSLTGGMNIAITANRMEDASYYSGYASVNIRVLPAGTDPQFYYSETSVNLDNQGMSSQTPMLNNTTGIAATPTYQSSDTNVATVDAYGTISFVGAGNTTVTATLSDGNETHTATITVYCNVIKQTSYATWIDPSTQMSSNDISCTGGTTIQFGGTPLSGWIFTSTIPMIDQSTGQITVPTGDLPGTQYTVNASYTEDATYYAGSGTLTITIS